MSSKLKAVFLGSDLFSMSLEALLARDDVEVRAVFAGVAPGHEEVKRIALKAHTRLLVSRIDLQTHRRLLDGVDLVLSAGYSWKIPQTGAALPLNLHPTLLPMGRGAHSIPWVLFDRPEAGGVTLHVMTERFDAGAVVANREIEGVEGLSFEAYIMFCNQFGAELADQFLDAPKAQFDAARPQAALHPLWPAFPNERRRIHASMRGQDIIGIIRKLGPIGALLDLDGRTYTVRGGEFVPAQSGAYHRRYQKSSLYSALTCLDGLIVFKPFDLRDA